MENLKTTSIICANELSTLQEMIKQGICNCSSKKLVLNLDQVIKLRVSINFENSDLIRATIQNLPFRCNHCNTIYIELNVIRILINQKTLNFL